MPEASSPNVGALQDTSRPLSQEEIAQVERMFSDPLAVPSTFKNWLIAWLEANPPVIPLSQVFGISSIVPAGVVWAYAGTAVPVDWLSCNGQSISKTVYPNLFKALGYYYGGSGDNFSVPDLRGRGIIGLGFQSGVATLGQTEGQPLNDRHPRHYHYPEWAVVNAAGGGGFAAGTGSPNYPVSQVRVGYTGPASIDTAAYIVMHYIIKT